MTKKTDYFDAWTYSIDQKARTVTFDDDDGWTVTRTMEEFVERWEMVRVPAAGFDPTYVGFVSVARDDLIDRGMIKDD